MKLLSWNVNGLQSIMRKGALQALVRGDHGAPAPDVLCLQEIRCGAACADKLLGEVAALGGYDVVLAHPCTAEGKKGYAGTALLSRGLGAPARVRYGVAGSAAAADDPEGRVIVAEWPAAALTVVCCYTPNAGQGTLKRLQERVEVWDPAFRGLVRGLVPAGGAGRGKKAPLVLICGDLNVAHQDVDLYKPDAAHARQAGFTPQERAGFGALLEEAGVVDSFRAVHGPEAVAYSWWSNFGQARAKNHGWRIDYVLVNQAAVKTKRVLQADVYADVPGSDHAPVGIVWKP
jgi:exodeoxyribonuclease III